jgi:hypothetical protein
MNLIDRFNWKHNMREFTRAEQDVIQAAKALYTEHLRTQLERDHMGQFVAIEPISTEYFLGKTLSEAVQAARKCFPDRLPHVMRVGLKSAIHFGNWG